MRREDFLIDYTVLFKLVTSMVVDKEIYFQLNRQTGVMDTTCI